jgi:hypothetical protein
MVEFYGVFTMLARTPTRNGRAVSYDRWSCPQCAFSLTVVHSRRGTSVEYDLQAWERECRCPGRDSPLACPCVGRHIWKWLSPCEQAPAQPARVSDLPAMT